MEWAKGESEISKSSYSEGGLGEDLKGSNDQILN